MAPQIGQQFRQPPRRCLRGYGQKGLQFICGCCPWQRIQTQDDTLATALRAFLGGWRSIKTPIFILAVPIGANAHLQRLMVLIMLL